MIFIIFLFTSLHIPIGIGDATVKILPNDSILQPNR